MRSKILVVLIIIAFLCPSSIYANFQHKKMLGKLTMVAILSTTAFVTKKLVNRDIYKTYAIRQSLPKPDKIMEFQDGFDRWQIEWYGDSVYVFKNGIFHYRRNLGD